MALLFKEYCVEEPSVERAIKMCVVHDLIEIYAGDTFAYDVSGNASKADRENEAADRLFAQLPSEQGAEIRALWEEFDAMETTDAKYAACLDRIQPFLHNTLTEGHTWRDGGAVRSQVEKRMTVVREFMPEVYKWISSNLDRSVERGWINE
jgi:putative hydrolase of HD superfamily